MTKRTKFAAALMIITAGSALIGAGTAGAEEVKARHGHMPPPREWREPPHHGGPGGPGGPGGHMPPPDWDRGPGGPGGHGGPRGHMPPPDWDRGPGGPGRPAGHMPPPDRGPGGHGGPRGHMPPPDRGVPPRW